MTGSIRRQVNKRSNALIIFTREPEPGLTKTRLMPYFSPEQCAEFHRCMLEDISHEMSKADADIIVAYTASRGREPEELRRIFRRSSAFIGQRGDGLGARMENAISDAFALGYSKVILIGTDIPELEAESIDAAFAMLDACDVVIGPVEDGGYYLIGMKELRREAFDVKLYGVSSVFEETVDSIRNAGLTVGKADMYADIDIPEDIHGFRERMREDAGLRRSAAGRFLRDTAKISVVLPVYNESAEIGKMIKQLKSYSGECEIIFADGGSTDDTAEQIREAGGFGLISSEKGRGIQMNSGALASSGDILFFLHCDSRLPEGFVKEIRRIMAKSSWGCFGVRFPSRNFFMLTNRIISNDRAGRRGLPFGDQGIFIDRELFFEMGMFPEIPVMEDYEFSRKMKRYGIRPGMARRRIISSARRYGSSTLDILKTELHMWNLRRLYRKGVPADQLGEYYRDIR